MATVAALVIGAMGTSSCIPRGYAHTLWLRSVVNNDTETVTERITRLGFVEQRRSQAYDGTFVVYNRRNAADDDFVQIRVFYSFRTKEEGDFFVYEDFFVIVDHLLVTCSPESDPCVMRV